MQYFLLPVDCSTGGLALQTRGNNAVPRICSHPVLNIRERGYWPRNTTLSCIWCSEGYNDPAPHNMMKLYLVQ